MIFLWRAWRKEIGWSVRFHLITVEHEWTKHVYSATYAKLGWSIFFASKKLSVCFLWKRYSVFSTLFMKTFSRVLRSFQVSKMFGRVLCVLAPQIIWRRVITEFIWKKVIYFQQIFQVNSYDCVWKLCRECFPSDITSPTTPVNVQL